VSRYGLSPPSVVTRQRIRFNKQNDEATTNNPSGAQVRKCPRRQAQSNAGKEFSMPKSKSETDPTEHSFGPEVGDGHHADDITVLNSFNGLRQTKLIRSDGTSEGAEYDTHFHHMYFRAASLPEIRNILVQLKDGPTCFVIRGRATDEAGEIHRRIWASSGATLVDVPRRWIMVDVDKPICELPDNWQDKPDVLVTEIVRKALPDAFLGAGVVWQWSSSMGVKKGVVKVHLWFRLDTAMDSKSAKRWLRPWNMYHDDSVFQIGQPHYTATPVFDGMNDPVRNRVGIIAGPEVKVPALEDNETFPDFVGSNKIVGHGYEYYRNQIGTQDFHTAMLGAVGSFVSKNWPSPDIEWLRNDLRQHVLSCDAPGRSQAEREHRAGGHLDKLIEWTVQRQGESVERQKQEMEEYLKIVDAEAEADEKRPAGRELQREFFAGLRR
jgi:hypothetical protein